MVEPIEEEWDLVRDGMLWKDVLSGFADSPEFKQFIETLAARFQNTADRYDYIQLLVCDRLFANQLRQKMVRGYESAHRQIARRANNEKAKRFPNPPGFPTEDATFPRPEIVDNILRYDQALDRQFYRDSIVLEQRQSAARQKSALLSRKRPLSTIKLTQIK